MSEPSFTIHQGDCLDLMKTLPTASVDAVVTDPPYGIRFMGKAWDGTDIEKRVALRRAMRSHAPQAGPNGGHKSIAAEAGKYDLTPKAMRAFQEFSEEWAAEALRVLKPGGYLLSFSSPRTYHRMVCGIEDAGFEIRDCIQWVFGSGFPKSLDVSKAVDGHITRGRSDSTALREVNETRPGEAKVRPTSTNGHRGIVGSADAGPSLKRDEPATAEGRQWQGWGTALKPAHEPIVVARKPLEGTVAANVLQHGTGALNIDGCRVGSESTERTTFLVMSSKGAPGDSYANQQHEYTERDAALPTGSSLGRFPANLIHDGSEEVLAAFPDAPGQQADASNNPDARKTVNAYGAMRRGSPRPDDDPRAFQMKPGARRLDDGSAARFFYCAKASRTDRNEGMVDPGPQFKRGTTLRDVENAAADGDLTGNTHPTVKPTDLMAYLVRLVTQPGGVVLDPFMGSGSTGKACMREGFNFIGLELDPAYIEIARARIEFERKRVYPPPAAGDQFDMFGEVA